MSHHEHARKARQLRYAAAPSSQAHLGIFSYLHLFRPAEKKCQLDCWTPLIECQENFEMSHVPCERYRAFRVFPTSHLTMRWRERAHLKSRIIDAHTAAGVVTERELVSPLLAPARVVRYSTALRTEPSSVARHGGGGGGSWRVRADALDSRGARERTAAVRSTTARSGFCRIASATELFRMGVWRLSRTGRTARYSSGRNRS
jgi:hypothetical protein